MTLLTDDNFTAAVRKAVEIRGEDYVYPVGKDGYSRGYAKTCVYSTPDGTPACLIGLALSLVDPTLLPDFDYEDDAGSSSADAVLDDLRRQGKSEVSNTVLNAAVWSQDAQDKGLTWGEALEQFEDLL